MTYTKPNRKYIIIVPEFYSCSSKPVYCIMFKNEAIFYCRCCEGLILYTFDTAILFNFAFSLKVTVHPQRMVIKRYDFIH